jgi:hypothetical protein
VTITCDGTVVTAASKNATAGTINYTVSANTGAARDGWIKVKYGNEDPHQITVSQLAGATARVFTYVFNNKSWGSTESVSTGSMPGNTWTSGKDGNQLTSGQGIQITTGVSGANATSSTSFSNVSKIVVTYCTNASKGVGTIKVKVGSGTEKSFTVTKPSSGGTTLKTAEFSFDPKESGTIKITADCTSNSVYIYSIAITATN